MQCYLRKSVVLFMIHVSVNSSLIKFKLLLIDITIFSSCSKPHQPIKNINQKPLIIVHTTGNMGGIEAMAGRKVSKDFGINTLYISHGCMVDNTLQNEIKKQKIKNEKAYKYYEKELGKDWKTKFNLILRYEIIKIAKRSFSKDK